MIDPNRKVLGFGINDGFPTKAGGTHLPYYRSWVNMIKRCYDPSYHKKHPTYEDCQVCEDWRYLSHFKSWFEDNYIEEYVLDKDLLFKGNKTYSPSTCVFIPKDLNSLLTNRKNHRGLYKVGVGKRSEETYKRSPYYAQISILGKRTHLGYFGTEDEAFSVYKTKKEEYIKSYAQELYREGRISIKVLSACLRYEVSEYD